MGDRASRALSLIAVTAACAVLFSGPSREVAARKGAVDADFGLTSTTGVADFWCRSEWTLYDPVEISYLQFSGDWMSSDSCQSPIPGVTVRTSFFPYGMVLENFPPGFRGPATLLACDFEVLHWECPPTLDELDQAFQEYEARNAAGTSIDFPSICASELDCDRWPCGDPKGPCEADVCGDPNHDGQVSATSRQPTHFASCRPASCCRRKWASCSAPRRAPEPRPPRRSSATSASRTTIARATPTDRIAAATIAPSALSTSTAHPGSAATVDANAARARRERAPGRDQRAASSFVTRARTSTASDVTS